jgi:N-acetylneuraminic acid mutarotase
VNRRLRPLLVLSLLGPLLAACGGGSSASPQGSGPDTHSSSPTSSPATQAFVPHTARASVLRWHLPDASGRQAVVPIGNSTVVLAGGLIAGDQSTDEALRIDLATGRILRLQSLEVPVHDVAGGLVGGVPAVVGGGNATEQNVVELLTDSAWHVVGHLPTTRSDLSIVQEGARAFVIGGYDGASVPTTILSLTADGSSRPVGHLVRGVRYAATARIGHTAYVFGGEVLGSELDTVQAVDLNTGRTRVVARLPVPLGHAMAAAVGSRILLMGGRVTPSRQTAAMWWFDPATDGFSRAGDLPHSLSDAAVASYGHWVWLLGGEDPAVTDQVVRLSIR